MALLLLGAFLIKMAQKNKGAEQSFHNKKKPMFLLVSRILTTTCGVGSVLLFVLTQNTKNVMVIADKWTIGMLGILLVQTGFSLFVLLAEKRKISEEDNNDLLKQ